MRTSLYPVLCLFLTTSALAQTPTTQPARYPALAEARQIMTSDSPYPYLSLFEPMEMSAKTGRPITGDTPEARLAELRLRYAAAVEEFTPEEKQTLDWFVALIDPLVADYPLYARTPWRFIKVAPTLESGFSHTRSDAIVFTAATVRRLTAARTAAGGDPDPSKRAALSAAGLLIHEKSHIIQRQHPSIVADLYINVWHFEHPPPNSVDLGPWLTSHQLLNPDGPDLRWVYKMPADHAGGVTIAVGGEGPTTATLQTSSYILPLVAFGPNAPDVPTNFAAFTQIAVNLDKTPTGFAAHVDATGKPSFQPINRVPAYAAQFAPASSRYHPNEILADLFSAMIIADTVAAHSHQPPPNTPPLGPLRTWLKTHFSKYAAPEVAASQQK